MRIRVLAAVAVVLLATACGSDGPEPAPQPTPSTTSDGAGPDRDGTVAASWDVPAEESPVQLRPADEGSALVPAGDRVVVLGQRVATAYDGASGETAWSVDLPGWVCAAPPSAGPDGLMVVMVHEGDSVCSRAVALDTAGADGAVRWSVAVPRAAEALGHEITIGPDGVVVAGGCVGFSVLAPADGAVTSSERGSTGDGRCPSAAGDGTTVVLGGPGRATAHAVASGERTGSWPAEGLGRIGDVVSSDPLVVTGRFASGGRLVDLGGPEPELFGEDAGGYGGEPLSAAVAAGTLWLQYEDLDEIVGYDLATHAEVGRLVAGSGATLVGAHDDRLVVTTEEPGVGISLTLVDPADPDRPQVVGVLPWPSLQEDGSLAGSAVVGDHLVRLWHGRLEAFEIP